MNIYKRMSLILIIISLLFGCAPAKSNGRLLTIEYIKVDGMTCIFFNGLHQGSVDCDWSKWNGNTTGIATDYEAK